MKNKIILITGGSSGIGKAAAVDLAKKGATIIIQARNAEKLLAATKEIERYSTQKVHYYSTDLTSIKEVKESAEKIVKEVGLPDIIINSAGLGNWLPFEKSDPQHFHTTIQSPYLVTAYTCKVFYELMKLRGTGHFITVNSAACYFSFPNAVGYISARWALRGFTESLKVDLHPTNFKVSAVVLGKVDSPYFKNNPVSEENIPKIVSMLNPTLSTEKAGKALASVVSSQKKTLIKPFSMAFYVFLNRFTPGLFTLLARIK